MLAYAFWHWPDPASRRYEEHIAAFQSVMAEHRPKGFLRGYTLAHPPAPWLPAAAYLDWYVVGGFADLQTLNEGAVSAARKGPHDAVAAQAKSGAGGIYAHAGGTADLASARVAHWFAKPKGIAYEAFLGSLATSPGSLWLRQMVLGPSPEFVLFGEVESALPVPALVAPVSRVWPRRVSSSRAGRASP